MAEFSHPEIGKIKGIRDGKVLSFRGLKYASLEHGFSDPMPLLNKAHGVVDARTHGPTAISPPMGCDMELGLIQKSLPHDSFKMSDTECLNLNLCIPAEQPSTPIPVFVFFHGGGFMIGSNAWPQYDLARIVALGEEINQPVIGIQINYRLGVHGFLYSEAMGKAGIKPNRGLLDQRAALTWITENIAGFGGDPNKITVCGESAGGVSAMLHLQSNEPLYTQLVAMGGNSLVLNPIPLEVAEATYNTVLSTLKIDPASSSEAQLCSILKLSPESWLQAIGPNVPMLPVVVGEIVRHFPTYAQWHQTEDEANLPGRAWCRRIMIGDCQFDGSILAYALMGKKAGISTSFRNSFLSSLNGNQNLVQAICTAYNITDQISDDEALSNILKFVTDLRFYASALTISQGWPGSAYVYHFNEPNPWDGPWKGESTHILDVAFLFQNFNQHLEPRQRESARKFATDFITFVAGEEPYAAYDSQEGGAQVYGPPCENGPRFILGKDPENYLRRKHVWDIATEADLDTLSRAFDKFIAS